MRKGKTTMPRDNGVLASETVALRFKDNVDRGKATADDESFFGARDV